MSLLTIVQDAITEMGGMAAPSNVIGNTDTTTAKALTMVNRLGRDIQRQYKWPSLKSTYTFTTQAGIDHYPLPSTWQRMSNNSTWDRTTHWPLNGPATDAFWQVLKSGLVVAGMRFWFRREGNYMVMAPVPTEVHTIAYDYYSSSWCMDIGGFPKIKMTSDTDMPIFLPVDRAESLLTMGLIYSLKASETLPFAEDKANYLQALDAEIFDASGQAIIDTTGAPRYILGRGNLPEVGYGSP